jgi:hypothetical protein
MRDDECDDVLLAAYVDGITELSSEERRRVESALEDPAVRADAEATRAVIGQLRELPREHAPDWAALELAIGNAVGPRPPRAWWRTWRLAVPALGLATAAVIALVIARPGASAEHADAIAEASPVTAIYVDGLALALEPEASSLLDELIVEALGDDDSGEPSALGELADVGGLAWSAPPAVASLEPGLVLSEIDELGDEELAELERWLEDDG